MIDENTYKMDEHLEQEGFVSNSESFARECVENDCVILASKLSRVNDAYNAMLPMIIITEKDPESIRKIYIEALDDIKAQASGLIDEIKTAHNLSEFDLDPADFIESYLTEMLLMIYRTGAL